MVGAEAKQAYREESKLQRHGHPGVAEEYKMTLASNYED
jgi:hypothetical protein